MGTLAEELARLANPTPVFHDPEDSEDFFTSAKVVEKDVTNEENDLVEPSKLRQKAALLTVDTDRKYAGKKISRQKLKDDVGGFSDEADSEDSKERAESEGDEDSSENPEFDDIISNVIQESESEDEADTEEDVDIEKFQSKITSATKGEKNSFSFVDDGDYSKYADDVTGDDDSDDDDDEETDDDEGDDDMENDDVENAELHDDGGITSFSKGTADEEVQKGQAAKYQLELWDGLLEGRIKFQKVVTAVNQLPQPDTWERFEDTGGDSFQEKSSTAQKMLKTLLDKLIQLQTVLLLQNNETKHIITGGDKAKVIKPHTKSMAEDDEEITSESEVESEPKDTEQTSLKVGMKRKMKMSDYPEFLSKRHADFQTFRNNTIQKWNDKTRLAGGRVNSKSFSAFEQSALKQIEQILSDRDRLVKRTQMKRSVYKVLGQGEDDQQKDEVPHSDMAEDSIPSDKQHNYDVEIFDDSDFYHQQLRELIEHKTADISDPVALSRQWLEIQKMRNKVKKKVDTRASKGRKTRYNVHSKLVNFMAPENTSTWTDEARTDLFSSLFGKRFQGKDTNEATEFR